MDSLILYLINEVLILLFGVIGNIPDSCIDTHLQGLLLVS